MATFLQCNARAIFVSDALRIARQALGDVVDLQRVPMLAYLRRIAETAFGAKVADDGIAGFRVHLDLAVILAEREDRSSRSG